MHFFNAFNSPKLGLKQIKNRNGLLNLIYSFKISLSSEWTDRKKQLYYKYLMTLSETRAPWATSVT